MAGPHTKIFYIWAAVMRQVRPNVIIAHNSVCNPTSASLETSTLVFELLSRRLSRAGPQREDGSSSSCFTSHGSTPLLAAAGLPASVPSLENQLALESVLRVFERHCGYTWRAYLVANETELAEALAGAMNRPDVKKRHAEGAVSHGGFHDEPGSFLCALNTRKRKRLEKFKETCQFCVVDVKHNVDQRPMHSMEGKLNTIVAQAGLMFLPELDVWSIALDGRTRVRELGECEVPRRWFTVSELYTTMGFPITEAAIDSSCGVTCCMSRGALGAFRRSRRNTMHLSSVGAAKVVLYLVLPCSGDCSDSYPKQSQQNSTDSRFQSAFHRALKRARGA